MRSMLEFYKVYCEEKIRCNWWYVFYTSEIYEESERNSAYCLKSRCRAGECLMDDCLLPYGELEGDFYKDGSTLYMQVEKPVWYA